MHNDDDERRTEACRPDCFRCKDFHVTYDRDFPYGCRKMAFKSRRLPALEVSSATGEACVSFEARRNPDKRTEQ